jgi:3-hydroxybutyrate dehydrogenase
MSTAATTSSTDRKLRGRSAIVTGSTSGIGWGIARALAVEGADVMLNGFGDREEIGRNVSSLAAECAVRVGYSDADMSRAGDVVRLVDAATHEFGKVDILVNNAGIQHTAPIEEFAPDAWDRVIAIDLSSAFHAMRAVLPQMRARDWGRIVNVASVHGLVASVHKAAYVAAKHGLLGLTKVVALETARTGITCNAICPGWVLTPLVEKQIGEIARREGVDGDEARRRLLAEKQPSHAFATPGEIGALAVFLASDAAAQVRGSAIPVDGGWLAQ